MMTMLHENPRVKEDKEDPEAVKDAWKLVEGL